MDTEEKELAKNIYEDISEIITKHSAFKHANTGLLQVILQYFGYSSREIGGVGLCKYLEISKPLSMLKKHENIIFKTICTGYISENGTILYNIPTEISISDIDKNEVISIDMTSGKEVKIW